VGVEVGVGVAVGVGVGVGLGAGSPPFVVRRIVPLSPTAMPVKASLAKETSLRFADVPLVCSLQVTPESFVRRILPPPPTANPMAIVGKLIPSVA
jgi:hypothetical protein